MLAALFLFMAGFIVQQVGVFFQKPSLTTTFVSAVAGLVFGLVLNPLTGMPFAPTVGGLVVATFLAFWGGFLFYVAYDMGRRP